MHWWLIFRLDIFKAIYIVYYGNGNPEIKVLSQCVHLEFTDWHGVLSGRGRYPAKELAAVVGAVECPGSEHKHNSWKLQDSTGTLGV